LGTLYCIPHGKISQACHWALGTPNHVFSAPRPGDSQQQRAAPVAGALAPPPPRHPRPGAGSGHPARVRAQPRLGHMCPCPPGGTLASGHRRCHHLHPSAVAGLIGKKEDGNLDLSSLAPPVQRGGQELHHLGAPHQHLLVLQPRWGWAGVPSCPRPFHTPKLLSSTAQSRWGGVTPQRGSWDVAGGWAMG